MAQVPDESPCSWGKHILGLLKYLNIKNVFLGRLTLYLLSCEVFIIKANSQSRAIEIVRFNVLTVN